MIRFQLLMHFDKVLLVDLLFFLFFSGLACIFLFCNPIIRNISDIFFNNYTMWYSILHNNAQDFNNNAICDYIYTRCTDSKHSNSMAFS